MNGPGKQTPGASLAVTAAAVLDIAVVISVVLLIRHVMLASPMMDPAQQQWDPGRYYDLGMLMSLLFLMLACASGMFSPRNQPEPGRLPALNLLNWALIILLGLYACRQYAVYADNGILLSKRVLFFSGVVLYGITTVIHYSLGMLLRPGNAKNREEDIS
jgi:hypothetical protein